MPNSRPPNASKEGAGTENSANAQPPEIAGIDFSAMAPEALEALAERLAAERVQRQIDGLAPLREEYAALLGRIEAAVKPFGLTANKFLTMGVMELSRHITKHAPNGAPSESAIFQRPTVKVAPKYRHPDNAELTWTGRGNKPLWVKDFIAGGRSIEEALIKRAG